MKYKDYTDQQIRQYAKTKPIKDWRKQLKNGKSNQKLLDMVPSVNPCFEAYALDIGCGEGYHSFDLRQMGYSAYGIELSEKRAKDGRAMGRTYIKQGDMHDMTEYEDGRWDLVFMHEVLEHSLYPLKVLESIHRILSLGGLFVASLPLEGHWKKPQEAIDHDFSVQDMHPWKPTAAMLWNALKEAGFSDFEIKLYTLDSIVFKQNYKLNDVVKGYRPHAFVKAIKT